MSERVDKKQKGPRWDLVRVLVATTQREGHTRREQRSEVDLAENGLSRTDQPGREYQAFESMKHRT